MDQYIEGVNPKECAYEMEPLDNVKPIICPACDLSLENLAPGTLVEFTLGLILPLPDGHLLLVCPDGIRVLCPHSCPHA